MKPERRQEYIDAHASVSTDLMRRYRDAGIRHCSVYLLGDELVMILDADNHETAAATLSKDAVDRAWQAHVGPMKEDGDWQEMTSIFHAELG